MGEKNVYDIILEKINSYSYLPEIVSNKDVVSAYDLKNILKESLSKSKPFYDVKKLKKRLNIFNLTHSKNLIKLGFNQIKKMFRMHYYGECLDVKLDGDEKNSIIEFMVFNKNRLGRCEFVTVSKKKDSELVSLDTTFRDKRILFYKKFIDENEKIIRETFKKMEGKLNFFDYEINCHLDRYSQEISDENFLVGFYFSFSYNFEYTYKLKDENLRKVVNKEWMGRKSLKKIIYENEDLILKRIPVNVKDLKRSYKKIVDYYFNEKLVTDDIDSSVKIVDSVDRYKDINSDVSSLVSNIREKYERVNVKNEYINQIYLDFLYSVIDLKEKGINIESEDLQNVFDCAKKINSVMEQKVILPYGDISKKSDKTLLDGNIYVDKDNKIKVLRNNKLRV